MHKPICFVVMGFDRGGIETYLLRFIEHFQLRNILIISKRESGGELKPRFIENNCTLYHVPVRKFSFVDRLKFSRILIQHKVNTIVDFTGEIAALEILFSMLVGVESRIVFYRNSRITYKPSIINSFLSFFLRRLIELTTTHILSNSYQALKTFHNKHYTKREAVKYRVIRNGINSPVTSENLSSRLRNEYGIKNKFVVGNVSRFAIQKNHIKMFEISDLVAFDTNIQFLFVGRGVEQEFHSSAKAYRSRPVFTGQININDGIYGVFDLFIFLSKVEGMPNALMEALSLGIPCIISDIDVHREILPQEYHEVLVHPDDTLKAIEQIFSWQSGKMVYDTEILKEHVLNMTNPKDRFMEFYNILCS